MSEPTRFQMADWPGQDFVLAEDFEQMQADAELGAAWREAEAALPEGTTLGIYWQLGAWHATYQHKHTECPSCGGLHQCEPERETINWPATGPTPAAALRALAERLKEVQR